MVCYSTRKSSKWGVCSLRGSSDPPNGSYKPWWKIICIDKVLKDIHKKIWHFYFGIRITQKMVCYITRKSSKWCVCSLRGSFDPSNRSNHPWWTTICIDKVLMDVNEKIWHFWRRNSYHPKNGVLLHTKIVEMRRMLASGIVWPCERVGQAVMANRMHSQGHDGRQRKNLAFLTSESGSPKKWCAIANKNRRNDAHACFRALLTLQMGRTSRDGKPYA